MMMMMMCYDCALNSWLWGRLSLAHSTRVKTDMPEKTITAKVRESDRWEVGLWRKGFVEKMSFESGVEERRSSSYGSMVTKQMANWYCEINDHFSVAQLKVKT